MAYVTGANKQVGVAVNAWTYIQMLSSELGHDATYP
jgi:hypothetical protein